MAVVVSLRDIVDEMQMLSNERHAYLNKGTGELITITDDDIAIVENNDNWSEYPDWQDKILQDTQRVLSSDDFLALPSQFDVHEYEIMERFCLSVENQGISETLLSKIRGSGAFRKFKDTVYRYGIETNWFKFRDQAYKEIAVSWLEGNEIAYTDDMDKRDVA
jgi:hypothetical protein